MSISSRMCGPDKIISKKKVRHEGANRLYNVGADQEESTICKHWEQLLAASAYSAGRRLEYLNHYSSIFSFRQSSEYCPLCRQLLEWIDKETLSDGTKLENDCCSTTIQFLRVEGFDPNAQSFQGISHWIFSFHTSKKFPMEREVWRPKLKHSAGTGIHFILAHDRGPRSLVHRPIWRNVENVSLETRIETIHEWLQQCETEHSGCIVQSIFSQNEVLPARVLDLSQSESMAEVALVSPCNVEGSFKYLALSHCWGKYGIPIRTTSKNLIDHEKRLAIGSLPRTFRDAVRISKLLGYKFLWIDSLCIVQDDGDDWEREAAKMASIFHCADVVLSAASARNSTEGCGIDYALEPSSSIFLPFILDYKSDTQSRASDSPRTRLLMRRWSDHYTTLTDTWPIHKRGWIFQEILLARRVLYFVNGHMIWQCHHLLESEEGYLSKMEAPSTFWTGCQGNLSSTFLYDLNKQLQIGAGVYVWWDILGDFLKREFTKPEDTLPSLVGVIDLWKSYTGDTPILGMWQKDLPFHMCWFPEHSCSIVDRLYGQPSWCWTSVPQKDRVNVCHASSDYVNRADVVWQAAIGPIDIQWKGRPFVSHLKHARLSLYQVRATKGAFNQAMSYVLDNKEEKQFRAPETVKILPLIITKPTLTTRPGGARFHMHSLLLECVNLADGQVKHRRKGYAEFVSSSDCNESNINEGVEEIVGGIEVIDTIEMI